MKTQVLIGLGLLACSAAASAAGKCRSLDVAKLNKAIPLATPWRIDGGGNGSCSFSAGGSANSFGFSQTVDASADKAEASVGDSKQTIAADNRVNDETSIGAKGFSYSVKLPSGEPNDKSVFLFGHRGSVETSGYLNLQKAVTPAQRQAAAQLMFDSMAIAEDSKALAKATNCPYFDSALIKRLLPFDDLSIAVPGPGSCIVSAVGNVVMISVSAGGNNVAQAIGNMLKDSGCTVEPLPPWNKPHWHRLRLQGRQSACADPVHGEEAGCSTSHLCRRRNQLPSSVHLWSNWPNTRRLIRGERLPSAWPLKTKGSIPLNQIRKLTGSALSLALIVPSIAHWNLHTATTIALSAGWNCHLRTSFAAAWSSTNEPLRWITRLADAACIDVRYEHGACWRSQPALGYVGFG